MKAVAWNFKHLQTTYGGTLELFLAHYDGNQAAWKKYAPEWYKARVKYSDVRSGHKLGLAQLLLPKVLSDRQYEWVWLLDEDVMLDGVQADLLITDARASGAVIVQPALRQLVSRSSTRQTQMTKVLREGEGGYNPRDLGCGQLAPVSACRFRRTNFVQTMAPLIQPQALLQIFGHCFACIQTAVVTPVDRMWCSWTERQLGMAKETACAVLDQVTMNHRNLKTLPEMYTKPHSNFTNPDLSVVHKQDMIRTFTNLKVYQCVPLGDIPEADESVLARAKRELEQIPRRPTEAKMAIVDDSGT